MKEMKAAGGRRQEKPEVHLQYFFMTPTFYAVWNGQGARESFHAHLRATTAKLVAP